MNRTVLLGRTYAGTPMFRSLAFDLWKYEQDGYPEKARALLDAHNQINRAFGKPPVDLTQQFTANASSVASCCPSALARIEADEGFVPVEIGVDPETGNARVAA